MPPVLSARKTRAVVVPTNRRVADANTIEKTQACAGRKRQRRRPRRAEVRREVRCVGPPPKATNVGLGRNRGIHGRPDERCGHDRLRPRRRDDGPGAERDGPGRVGRVAQAAIGRAKQVAVCVEDQAERIVPIDHAVAAVGEEHVAPHRFPGAARRAVVLKAGEQDGWLGGMLADEVGAERSRARCCATRTCRPRSAFVFTNRPPSVPTNSVFESPGTCASTCTSACACCPMLAVVIV